MRHLDDMMVRLLDAIASGVVLTARVGGSQGATVSHGGRGSAASRCGRPLLIDDRPVLAFPAMRTDWLATEATGPGLNRAPLGTRDAIAEAWLEDALAEHASIASFARFSLELLAVGAPAELVRDAHSAALDEVEHARLCFSLAEHFGGEACGPGHLELAQLSITTDLRQLVASAVREGCVRETVASISAREQLSVATDPMVRHVLDRIASDEARHSDLAWRFVSWATAVGGTNVGQAAQQAFEAELATPTAGMRCDDVDVEGVAWWHRAGRLTPKEIVELTRVVDERVIAVAAKALLERPEAIDFAFHSAA